VTTVLIIAGWGLWAYLTIGAVLSLWWLRKDSTDLPLSERLAISAGRVLEWPWLLAGGER